MPESQDPVGFDLGLYNLPGYMNKEDMGILTTTLDGIVNMLTGIDNKLTDLKNYNTSEFCLIRDRLSRLEVKVANMQEKMRGGGSYQKKEDKGSGDTKKTRQTDPCFICKELWHWVPDCPRKKQDLCYKCGKFGHWANKCPEDDEDQQFLKEVEKLEKKPQEPKTSGTHQTKPLVKEGEKKGGKVSGTQQRDSSHSQEETTPDRKGTEEEKKMQLCWLAVNENVTS
ncbi:uncharacterized protein LOC134283014 [Saccostrea cucullata]|uniref:uncharacterized protein LOC134283014 n=1 Tax=Saccostrea cuccullata TaxID=36930 RepID=UPI002ED299C1